MSEDAAATSFVAQDEFVVSPGVTVTLNDGTIIKPTNSKIGGAEMINTGRLTSSKPTSRVVAADETIIIAENKSE